MNISIIGCGYVGLTTGIGLADKHNHKIYFVDNNPNIISKLKKGRVHFYEQGLSKKLVDLIKKKKIYFSTSYKDSINLTQLTFVAVGTPSDSKGKIDLKYIKKSSVEIGRVLKEKKLFHSVIYKSTVPPGTAGEICLPLLEKNSKKKNKKDFGIGSNPEFLREGSAVYDFENPSRIIIGYQDKKTRELLDEVYKKFKKNSKIIYVNLRTAEMIKYFSNCFFSMLISFGNEFGNLCSKVNIDFMEVLEGLKYDNRITKDRKFFPEFIKYLYPGIGYGGSCFPKDTKAIINFSTNKNSKLRILKEVDNVNEKQVTVIVNKILKLIKKKNIRHVLILGVSFKENSDDLRNSASIKLIKKLLKLNIKVNIYDELISKSKFKEIKFESKSIINKVNFIKNKNKLKNFKFIIVNNRSDNYKEIITKLKKNKFFLFDSRRFFEKKLFKNYSGAGI